jgi:parallel beta-helix repeat protein
MKLFRPVLSLLALVATAATASAATRVVDDDGHATSTNCSAATVTPFTTVNAALAASNPGDTIVVCAGVYNEQLDITKRVTITGRIDPNDPQAPTIKPNPMVANTTSLSTGNPIAAVILVDTTAANATVIEQLTVDAGDNGFGGSCAVPNIIGVYYRNASGTVRNSVVKNTMMADPTLLGCQVGLGIFAQSDAVGGTSALVATANSVHEYGKNGITGNGPGTSLTATGNSVTGVGATQYTAQNGIQIGFGAIGTVTGNHVNDHYYSQCAVITDEACGGGSASGILLFQVGNGVTVSSNTVGTSQTGIYQEGNLGTIISNVILNTIVYDGIYVLGDTNTVTRNGITDSDESGIFIDGTGNTVTKNTINEAPVGIIALPGNTTPVAGSNRNVFYNVGATLGAPESLSALSARSAGVGSSAVVASPAR